ncbi:MAG: hypothetical protein ABIA93_05230 [Candidatus Woesearchaeota archaeon]
MEDRIVYQNKLVNPPEGMIIDALRTLPCFPSAADIEFHAHPRVLEMQKELLEQGHEFTREYQQLHPNVVPFQHAHFEYEPRSSRTNYTVHGFGDKPDIATRINADPYVNNAITGLMAKIQASGGRPSHFHVSIRHPNAWRHFENDHWGNLTDQGYTPADVNIYLDAPGDPKFHDQGLPPTPTQLIFRPDNCLDRIHSDKVIYIVGTTGMNVETAVKQWFDELQRRHGINPEEKEITGSPSGTTFTM